MKISDKIDKQFNKVKDKGYAGIREFRKSMVDLVDKDDFRNFVRTQKKVTAYVNDKFKNIKDVNTFDTEKAMDKYYKVGGKERGVIDDLAKEFNVNSDTLKGNIQKVGRKKIPIKYGDVYEKRKAVKEKRTAAEKKFSDPSFEAKMSGTKAVQKSHMDDLYSKVVTADTLGYAPERINNEILKDVDPYLNSLYEKRKKLLKNKPKGFEKAVEEINQKGISVAQATDGYKSFQIEQPDGKKYQFGVQAGKTIDPTGITEGKQIKGNVEKIQFEGGKKPTATLTPDPVDQYFFEENRKAVMEAQKKVPKSKIKKIAKEISDLGFDTKRTQLNAKLPIISTMYDVASAIKDDVGKAKYLSAGFKALGLAVTPYIAYTTYQDIMAGKNLVEALESNIIGTNFVKGTRDRLAMSPEERQAEVMLLNTDMPTGFGFIEAPPVEDMSLEEAKQKFEAAQQRVAKERAEDEAGVAAIRRQALDKVIDTATGNRTTAMKLAGGGLLKQAGKRSGPPPEKGPGGLASLEDYARTMME